MHAFPAICKNALLRFPPEKGAEISSVQTLCRVYGLLCNQIRIDRFKELFGVIAVNAELDGLGEVEGHNAQQRLGVDDITAGDHIDSALEIGGGVDKFTDFTNSVQLYFADSHNNILPFNRCARYAVLETR